jgi:hypothetical protein
MLTILPPPPRDTAAIDAERRLSRPWQSWLDEAVIPRVQAAPFVIGSYHADQAEASIATTDVPDYDLEGGYLRVSYALRLTQAATTSSGVTATVTWTERGFTRTRTTPALNTNALAQYDSGVFMVQADPGTAITVATTYVSVGATPMQYGYDVFIERMPR